MGSRHSKCSFCRNYWLLNWLDSGERLQPKFGGRHTVPIPYSLKFSLFPSCLMAMVRFEALSLISMGLWWGVPGASRAGFHAKAKTSNLQMRDGKNRNKLSWCFRSGGGEWKSELVEPSAIGPQEWIKVLFLIFILTRSYYLLQPLPACTAISAETGSILMQHQDTPP